ncbi:hypothetical protein [Leifsonia sp. NPDC077715]|uniref:hypothetical protein n=1 Tax=Leifsonia sp. NPDC077715 TaxID=3155539 RepID=UPI003436AAE8
MFEGYRPFGYSDDEWEASQVLIDGAPDEMRQLLYHPLARRLTRSESDWLDEGVGLLIRAKIKVDLGERAGSYVSRQQLLMQFDALSDLELLRLVDFVLLITQPQREDETPTDFAIAFDASSSKWAPQWDGTRWALLERVPQGVQTAVENTISTSRSGGRLLQEAWAAAYGIQPDAGAAYRASVRAVEAAAHDMVEPRNQRATLGTMARVIDDQKTWTLPLTERDDHVGDNRALIVRMMLMLYEGQQDRHGAGAITLDEARTAVHAAATLVAWFNAGYVTNDD